MPSQDALDIHQSTLLSDVTISALQLIQQPFGPAVSEAETFTDDTSLEQLADVKQALIGGDDLLLILGEAGAGKSVLLNQLGTNSGQSIQCFAVKGSPRFSTLNLFAGMLEAFKHKPPEQLKDILDELAPCLQTMVTRNTLSAIVLDDADQISETELTQLLSGMLYINSQEETLMRVALAAPPEFEDRIPDLLPEGADLPYSSLTIEGMDSDRAADYIAFRLQEAGYAGELPLSDQDMDDIVGQSGGLPSGIHAAAAGVLNQLYDPMQHPPVEEFQSVAREPFLQSRNAKFGLGAVALLLIVGGLMMFTPEASDDNERYADSADSSTTAVPTSERLSTKSLTEADLPGVNRGATSLTGDLASADDTDSAEDTPAQRVVEERKVVPFTSEAIESLVPDIARPSSTTDSSDGTASSASDTSASDLSTQISNATDSLEQSAADSARSAVADVDAASTQDSSIDDLADVSTDQLPDAALLPEDDLVADTDLLPGTADDEQQAPPVSATDAAPTSNTANTDTGSVATAPQTFSDETPDVDPALADILESPTWILVQDSNKITVQMSASRDRPSIESFLKRNRNVLPPPNSIYTFQRRGETWYALLHGLYSSFEEAQLAVEQMPDSAVTDQPWIRNVGRVQDVLKAQ